MQRPIRLKPAGESCEILDFDEARLDACGPEARRELMGEARILAHALGEPDLPQLEQLAHDLSVGERDDDMDRTHARLLSAALRRLARSPR